ncbi:hypothetical protein Y032_0677g1440 [Ancylostoma ceylanicum]|uniref:Reverse transcriptase domain-containing protein n=1 Tax=Ancylostoma ceylanicum TaxID=53326 RepID=A0A016WHL8_9BILA|nr:hypothetical protein Y032_0677g1440 [Ancylostoma ceylanicum]
MLADFDDACGKIGLQLNITKTMFMRNGWVPDAPFSLNRTTISECSSYVYLGISSRIKNGEISGQLSEWHYFELANCSKYILLIIFYMKDGGPST